MQSFRVMSICCCIFCDALRINVCFRLLWVVVFIGFLVLMFVIFLVSSMWVCDWMIVSVSILFISPFLVSCHTFHVLFSFFFPSQKSTVLVFPNCSRSLSFHSRKSLWQEGRGMSSESRISILVVCLTHKVSFLSVCDGLGDAFDFLGGDISVCCWFRWLNLACCSFRCARACVYTWVII